VMFVDLSGKSKEFMEAHDATKLLLQYMKDWRDESSLFSWNVPYAHFIDKTMNWDWNVKYNNAFKELSFDGMVYIEWQKVELSEIWNFLVWYNWNHAWFNMSAILASWYTTEVRNYMWSYKEGTSLDIILVAALLDELQDIPWYAVWYKLASNENKFFNTMNLQNSILLWNVLSDIALNETKERKNELDSKYSTRFSRNNLYNNEY
jgi:hypothetical protein